MDKVLVAFDVDGTLRDNTVDQSKPPVANEGTRTGLIWLSSMKNVKILVWSGGGELYARQVVAALGLDKYVDYYAGKELSDKDGMGVSSHSEYKPDIAIDDIQRCKLGSINLIVKEK